MLFFPPDISPDIFDNYNKQRIIKKKKEELAALQEHITKTPNVSLSTMMAYGTLYTELQK